MEAAGEYAEPRFLFARMRIKIFLFRYVRSCDMIINGGLTLRMRETGMNRKQKLFLNGGMGLLKQIVAMICGFLLPRFMLEYYGSEVNGLVSSITHFLSFISLMEMGIGPVIQANLYTPLAEKNNDQISRIVISSERFFRRIAVIFLIYIAVLMFVFPTIVNREHNPWFSASLVAIIAVSTFAQYFFGATYQLLLNADQKSYVHIALQIITTALNAVFCIILIKNGASVHIVKLVTAAIFVVRPLLTALYVRKHYEINKHIKLTEEPIKQKWNGFAQHVLAVVCENIDVVVLTLFSTLASVSVYSVYFNVANGLAVTVIMATTGLESYFGNMIARKENDALNGSFERVEFIMHTAVTIVFTIAAITIVPFAAVYTRGINDADYLLPAFGTFMALAYASRCLRVPYFSLVKSAGHFKQTQNGAFISTAINAVLSLVLVFKWGLVGVAAGTFAAMMYHTCYLVWYLHKNIINRPIWHFVKYVITDAAVLIISYFLTKSFIMAETTYLSWLLLVCKAAGVTIGTAIVVNLAVNWKTALQTVKRIKGKSA